MMLNKTYSKKPLRTVFSLVSCLIFVSSIVFLSSDIIPTDKGVKVGFKGSYLTRLVRQPQSNFGAFSDFLDHLHKVKQEVKDGKIGGIEILTSIKSLGQGTYDIYDKIFQQLIKEYNGNPGQILKEEDPVIRHDIPGVLYLVEQFKGEFLKHNPLIYVSDGGFNQRAGVKTLAYGHQGLISLPGNNNFRNLLFRLGMGLYESLPANMKGRYMVWVASDNFLSPGDINWNGQDLSDLPSEARLILSGAKTQLLSDSEMDEIKKLSENWDMISKKIEDKDDPTFSRFREVVEGEKIKELGIFAVNPDTGRVSGFKEKEKDLGELAKFAYEKGKGAVYKNAFVNFVNKDLLIALQEELSKVESVNPKLINLSRYSLSWFQSMLQGRFVDEAEWIDLRIDQIKPEGLNASQIDELNRKKGEVVSLFSKKENQGTIQPSGREDVINSLMSLRPDFIKESDWKGLVDWVNYKRVLDDVVSEEDLYAIDLDVDSGQTQGFWYDAGNLKVLNQVLGSVVDENPNIRNKARQVLGIPTDKNVFNLDLRDKSKVQYDGDNYYLENVRINGGGTLVIEDGVVLKDVYLNIPEGETLVITPDSKIIESDLRGVNVKFEGRNGVIDRYFPHGEKDLRINGFEWVSSIKVGERVITARNPILLPFKGKTIQQIAINIGEEILGKNATNANKAIRGWKELNNKYPQLFGEYQYNEIKDKELIQLDNLNGYTFMDALLKYIDFEWMYGNVDELKAIVGP